MQTGRCLGKRQIANKMRHLIIYLLLIFSTCANSATVVTFVNGADVDDRGAVVQQAAFKAAMQKHGAVNGSVKFIPRTIAEGLTRAAQIHLCQSDLAKKASPSIGKLPSSSEYSKYYINIGRLYTEKTEPCLSSFYLASSILAQTEGLANQIEYTLSGGNKVVIVAYSQGNLYTEAALGLLRYSGRLSDFSNIRVINIGNTSQSSLNGFNVTSTMDEVVANAAWLHFPPVYTPCYAECARSATYQELIDAGMDSIGHYFMPNLLGNNTYLNENIKTVQTKTSFPAVIAGLLKRAISELDARKVERIRFDLAPILASRSITDRILAVVGIASAQAQDGGRLYANAGEKFYARIDGIGFSGSERLIVSGSTCDVGTISRGVGFFTQECFGGSAPGGEYSVNVVDDIGINIYTPPSYSSMSLLSRVFSPLAPTLSDAGGGVVHLVWPAVSGATGYKVYRDSLEIATTGAVLEFDDPGRSQGIQACYRLRAISGSVLSSFSPEACITPAALRCSGQWSTSSYEVGQTESTTQGCPVGYTGSKALSHVCQSNGSWGVTTTKDTCVAIPPTQCIGIWSGAKYAVGQIEEKYENGCPAGTQGQVRYWHACQSSGDWSPIAQSDNCTAYLTPPGNVYASSVGSGMQVTWSASPGATQYFVNRNGYSGYGSTAATSFTDSSVVDGGIYCYTVAAYSSYDGSTSANSAEFCATYRSGQQGVNPPSNVAAAQYFSGSRKGIRLTWTQASGADSYNIYRRDRAGIFAPVAANDSSFVDWSEFSLVSGYSYCYYIRSVKGGAMSTESNEACSIAP